jgi:hypothetical protein
MNIESQKRYRTFLIVLVYVTTAVTAIALGIYEEISPEKWFFYSIIQALILTKICIVDSRIVGKPLSTFSYWLIFLFYGFAVPICIIRAHGKFGLVILAAHFIGLILVCITALLIGDFLVYGGLY